MNPNTGDMVLSSETHAAIWDGSAFLQVEDAQISIDNDTFTAIVRVGATPVPPTGVLIFNAPGFSGWTGHVVRSGGEGVARDPRDENAESNGGGGGGD